MVALSEFIEANTNIIQQQSRLSGYALTTKITKDTKGNRIIFALNFVVFVFSIENTYDGILCETDRSPQFCHTRESGYPG
jgi:hypothetical protein